MNYASFKDIVSEFIYHFTFKSNSISLFLTLSSFVMSFVLRFPRRKQGVSKSSSAANESYICSICCHLFVVLFN